MTLARRIIIAAGHGGTDSGAVARGRTEAKEAADIVNRTVALLKKDGRIKVVQVPNSLGLKASVSWVNARYKKLSYGLSLEVHKNSGGGTGTEVWYPSWGDSESRSQAKAMANVLARESKLKNRGIKDARTNRHGKLYWTDDTNTYALLAEVGFIDVDPVGATANKRYAEALFKAILAVWGLKPKPKPTPKPQPKPTPKPEPNYSKLNHEILTKIWNWLKSVFKIGE